jgi:hypothetical protein
MSPQGHGTARHGMRELTYTVSRPSLSDLPSFGFFRPPGGVSRSVVRIFPVTRGPSRRTRHCRSTVGTHSTASVNQRATWHGRDVAWLCVNYPSECSTHRQTFDATQSVLTAPLNKLHINRPVSHEYKKKDWKIQASSCSLLSFHFPGWPY